MGLSTTEITAAKPRQKLYRLFDGEGLHLEITPAGGKHRRVKYRSRLLWRRRRDAVDRLTSRRKGAIMEKSAPTPLRHSIEEATALLSVSRSTLYERIGKGLLRAHKDGGRRFVSAAEIQRYLAGLESAGLS